LADRYLETISLKTHRDSEGIIRGKTRKRRKIMRLEPGFPVLGQAVPAVDRPSFSWFEGDFALFATV
jgi:hypothetical protein